VNEYIKVFYIIQLRRFKVNVKKEKKRSAKYSGKPPIIVFILAAKSCKNDLFIPAISQSSPY